MSQRDGGKPRPSKHSGRYSSQGDGVVSRPSKHSFSSPRPSGKRHVVATAVEEPAVPPDAEPRFSFRGEDHGAMGHTERWHGLHVALPVVEEWMTAETPSPVPSPDFRSEDWKMTERWGTRSDGTYILMVMVQDNWRTKFVKVHVVNETPSFSLREWEAAKGRNPQAWCGPQPAPSTASPSASSATALPSALSRTHRSVRTQTGNLSLEARWHVDDDPFP